MPAHDGLGALRICWGLPEESVPLMVTPDAIVRLVNEPTGADSKVTSVLMPEAAVSNVAASAAELGKGMPGPAPGSAAVKTTGAAFAVPAMSANAAAAVAMARAVMIVSSAGVPVPLAAVDPRGTSHKKMLTFRLRSISHIEATATMLSEPAPRTSRG
jgi:hypothetical protein